MNGDKNAYIELASRSRVEKPLVGFCVSSGGANHKLTGPSFLHQVNCPPRGLIITTFLLRLLPCIKAVFWSF